MNFNAAMLCVLCVLCGEKRLRLVVAWGSDWREDIYNKYIINV